ncbi:MAG: hypothetical protein IJJ80_09580 [Clostridia bacterium]|nr:hypothetical protein [Clostridia bacterium]
MSGFITALIKQRREAKKAEPDTNGRLREILGVLKKYDYDDGITPEIVTSILQDLGPTFVKIGQIASQQADYIPHEYCEALVKLRSKVAPMDMETVHAQIEKYLGKPVDELYASFDDKPLGSASIAQVHKATLHDGTVVAVKVRRPGIVDTVARDFALIEKILDKFVKKGQGGIIAIEGTIKTLSPNVNILNFFTDKVNICVDFKLDLENPEKMNPEIAMKLLQLFQGVTDSSVKTAESLDMLEKGQIKVRTDFCFEEKTLTTVNRLVSYLIRVLIVIALLIGSSLLCTAPTITGSGDAVTIIFRMVGFVGYALSVFYAYLLYRDVKKGK